MSGGRTLWLVGMMGAGKSAVGPELARLLGLPFADADRLLEAEAGGTVAEIFEREGEAGFRDRERRVVESLAGRPLVVALGGGAVAQPGLAERVAAAGTVVYLRAGLDTLLERIGEGGGRPLLAGLDREGRRQRLSALLARREPVYLGADLVVDTDGLAPVEVAERIARALRKEGA